MRLHLPRTTSRVLVALGMVGLTAAAAHAQSQSPSSRSPFETAVAVHVDTRALTPVASTEEALAAYGDRSAVRPSFLPQSQGASADDSGIGFGVLLMLTRTSFRGDDGDFFDLEDRNGWGAGLWVGGNRNGRVGFTGEFIYLRRGNDDGIETTALQIPAVFHINFGSRSRDSVGGYVVVGPSFTINLKQKLFGVDVDDNFAGADIGVIAGVGVEFFRVGVEGRGNWGLRNIDTEGDFGESKTFTFELLGKFAFN